jgi:hypothetical protein
MFARTRVPDSAAKENAVKKSARSAPTASPAKQIAGFIAKFDPEVARVIRSARATLRKRFPTAIEQVYDNYNFLAIGFCTTERTSDCIVALAAQAKGVSLSFYYGASLPDPCGILQGNGNQNRFIRLEDVATLANPDVQTLLAAAVAQAKSPLPATGRGYTLIKSISAKQRPRRLPQK